MIRLRMFLIAVLLLSLTTAKAQIAEISPLKPQVGDVVKVVYHAGKPGSVIGADADSVNLVFTYSTFYHLPWKMPMKRQGSDWVASFQTKPHATYATFYFQSGTKIDKPGPESHYSIAVYQGDKRVFNGYLHESYSLGAQRPKSPDLNTEKVMLLNEELKAYPDNYEAKIRLQSALMAQAKTPAEKLMHRQRARQLIARQFETDPTAMENLNKVTMGYLIIGENSRLDSIRDVVIQRYPGSELGRQLLLSKIAKEKDQRLKIAKLEKLLKDIGGGHSEAAQDIHSMLFEYYAEMKDRDQALKHARLSIGKRDPYTSKVFWGIAKKLTENKLAPDTAISYARRSLALADEWPAGLILHFPRFGYIRTYVAEPVRQKAVSEARAGLFSLMALNWMYKGNSKEALADVAKAQQETQTPESLTFIALTHELGGNAEKAFDNAWKILEMNPSDTSSAILAKRLFLKFNPSEAGFNKRLTGLDSLKFEHLKCDLRKQMLNASRPALDSITDLEGNKVTKEMLDGKVVVLDFWATWCVPCMQELPYLQKVYDRYKNNSKVKFMVVNSGARNTITDAINWKKKNDQYTFPVFFNHDPDIGERVGFSVIPAVVILDQSGKMQFRTVGFEGEIIEKKVSASIEVLLK